MKKFIYLFFLTIISFLPLKLALANEGLNLKVDKTDLVAGDEITVRVTTSDDLDTYAMLATLKYDEKVFQKIDDTNFSVNETSNVIYNANNQKFGIINKAGKIKGEVFQVHLKVKEDANVGDTNIALTNISSSDGNNKEELPSTTVKVNVTRDAKENEPIPNYKENEIVEDKDSIIKTFSNTPIITIFFAVIIILLVAIIIAIIKRNKKLLLNLLALETILIIVSTVFIYGNINKKDINNDGVKDYQDAEEIIKYLIDIKGNEEDSQNEDNQNNETDSNQNNINPNLENNYPNNNTFNEPNQEVNNNFNSNSFNTNITNIPNKPNNNSNSNSNTNHNSNNNTINNNSNSNSPNNNNSSTNNNNSSNNNSNNNSNNKPNSESGNNSKPTQPENPNNPNPSKPNNNKPQDDYDTNNDGKVDVEDVGDVVDDVNKKSKVKLFVENEQDYVEKGHIILEFKADITPKDAKIVKVKIADNYYDATLNDDIYTVVIEDYQTPGIHNFTISEVVLNTNIKVKTNLKMTREVLKDIPYINKFNLEDEKRSLTFNLVDNDNAFIKGTVNIYDKSSNLIESKPVSKITTLEDLPLEEDKVYFIEIVGEYDLDAAKNDLNNHYSDKIMFTHEFAIGGDYNFTLDNISITDALKEGEKPIVTFTSTNTRKKTIANATFTNDDSPKSKSYNISKIDGNNYEVLLTNANTSIGKHTITLDNVGLDSLKTFENKKDFEAQTLTYTVLKQAPKIENLTLKDIKDTKNIQVDFTVQDKNQALNKLNVILVDSNNKIVSSKELSKEEILDEIELSLSYENNVDGFYTVKVLGDYELSDKYVYTNESLKEDEILIHDVDIYIDKMYVTNDKNEDTGNIYPNKNQQNYQIAFEVHVDDSINAYAKAHYKNASYQNVSSITINGLNYPANAVSGYKSKIYVNVPSDAGPLTLKANRVQLAINNYYNIVNDFYSVKEKTLTIDVLKDKPQIKNLLIQDDYQKQEATFDFDVVLDDTSIDDFKDATIELDYQTIPIKKGHNTITFTNVTKDTNLDLIFKGTYDLDSNTISNDKNAYQNEILYQGTYGLYDEQTYQSIAITNGQTAQYISKNEKVKLSFKIAGIKDTLEAKADKVIIDNQEYSLNNKEELILDGYNTSGEKELTITDIILSNGKKVKLTKPYKFKFEVLKDEVEITNYHYEDLEDKIKITSTLKDLDNALTNEAKIIITDESDNAIYNDKYQNVIEFSKVKDVVRYYIKIVADYDRDIDILNKANEYHNVTLLDELISLEENNIELKDITDINLYKTETKNNDEKINLIDKVSIKDIKANYQNYFVEVVMDNLPNMRARIKNVSIENNNLMLELESIYLTNGNNNTIKINFGQIKNDTAQNEFHPKDAFVALLEKLEAGDNVKLTRDLDASVLNTTEKTYVKNDYHGSLDGNGFTIKNLSKPLFNTLDKAEIKNLTLKEINLASDGQAGLANITKETHITNVIIDNLTKPSSASGQNGALIGLAKDNTIIENSGAKNVSISVGGMQQNGGLIGCLENSSITNSYAIGKVDGYWNFNGALVGNNLNGTITYSFAKVTVGGAISCDFACSFNNVGTYENNISLSSGGNQGFLSGGIKKSVNNYYVNTSLNNDEGVENITLDDVNDDLFINKALFNKDIWHINKTTADNLPILTTEKTSSLNNTDNKDYDETKETLYQNLTKLMPFFDSNKIIAVAKNVKDETLINEEIAHIVPIDASGNLVTYLTTDNPKKITNIKIIFKNGAKAEYNVTYDKTYDMVADYKIKNLNIDYNYHHYLLNSNSQVVNNLTNYLQKLDYTNNLDILTTNDDSRIYKDFYQEVTSKELKEFVLKYLANSDYTNTSNDDSINNYIEREVKKNQKIEKALYTYNYLRRFYDLDINGLKIYDFVLFNMKGFDSSLTTTKITDLFFSDKTGSNFNTNETNTKYNNVLSKYTKLTNVSAFLEYLVTHLSNTKMDEWTRSQFKGILKELPVTANKDIQYTLWDHLSTEDSGRSGTNYKVHNFVLPILTLPKTSAYIISGPVQFIIGSQRTYMKNPNNEEELKNFMTKLNSYTSRMSSYYNTAYSILQDEDLFNDMHLFQLDKRYTKNEFGASVYNNPNSTTELFHKNFNDVVKLWPASAGVNAGAWGDYIEWQVAGVLDSELATDGTLDIGHVTYKTWSHESAHNIDARLFLKNNGRRFDAGGEDYADDFLMQSFSANEIVMNLSINFQKDLNVGSNLTPERINSEEKVWDFYRKVFETIYVMDYIEAKAFLQLDQEDQKSLAVQASYPNEDMQFAKDANDNFTGPLYKEDQYAKYRARQTTKFTHISELDKEFKLNTIDDLIDNRIMLYPGVYKYSSRGSNSYGGEGFNTVHWYQPNNPDGRPDSYALKWISYEMLGLKGYDKGFVEYASNINYQKKYIYSNLSKPENGKSEVNYKTDSMALSKITDGKYSDFSTYKKARFKEVEKNLEKLDKVVNVKDYVQKFYEALKEDAIDMTTGLEKELAKNPNCPNEYWCSRGNFATMLSYQHSSEVRREIYYALKNKTNDFVEEIYKDTKQQEVDNLNVQK